MKKWMTMILIGAITAGLAAAEEAKVPWYKKMFGKSADDQTQVIPPAPAAPAPALEMQRMHRPEGPGGKHLPQVTPEQKEKIKAQHEALMKLGDMARNETDPVKKEALVAELRTKLTEIADKIQAEAKKRLEKAEQDLPKLRERLAEAEKNKTARIEEQLQRILAGHPLKGPEGKRPEGAPLKKEGKKAVNPPVTE